ncbi:MAG TPA: hypothetical protein VFX48_03445, partial [Saprospiraceae bacterium]|nr:hypothetical protein [Saprospiraceae bacterium]
MRSCMVLRYTMLIQLFLTLASFSHRAWSQTNCISVSSSVCAGDCVPVTYIGMGSQTASYQWSISCGTITNPNDQNPHTACFNTPGLCTIQVIWQERGNAPETCHVEVEVFPLPQGRLTLVSDSICKNNCTQLRVDLTGRAPYSFALQSNQAINNYVTNSSPYFINVCPDTTTLYSLLSVSDFFCTNTNPGPQTTLTVLPEFVGAVKQIHNELCAEPANAGYSWYACGDTNLLSNQACFSPPSDGCYCVVIDDGMCLDTVCESFKCDLVCSFYAPDTICVGDTALIYYTGNGGPKTQFLWVVDVDQFLGLRFFGVDTLRIPYTLPGCYSVNLGLQEGSCLSRCTDTICVIEKPCACDTFTKNQVVPVSTSAQGCCYEITGDIASLACFTAMHVSVSAGSFINVQANAAQGWSVRNAGIQNLRFEHNSGSFPPGAFNAGNFCVTGASHYVVTVHYYYHFASIQDSCRFQYVYDCKNGTINKPCDSLSSYLERQHTLPNICCYNIHMDQPKSNVFLGIHAQLSSGSFSSVQSNFLQGYNAAVTGPRDFIVTHSSGFLPAGPVIPASFCVMGAFNPVIVSLQYYYMTPQGLDSCSYRFLFDCLGGMNPNDCCDSTRVRIVPTTVTPDCCYEVDLYSNKDQCYSKICLETLSGSFSNITPNPGWSVDSSGPGICFVPNGGFIPTGSVKPGSFCVQGTGSAFQVNVDFIDANGMTIDSCKRRFTLECVKPPALCRCDSLKNLIVPVSIQPGNCCYDLFSTVPVGACFTGMQVLLSAGNFSNIQAGTGYTATPSGGQMININPISGFLPAGLIHPASFCVTGASAYQVQVLYFIQNAGKTDTCRFVRSFDCPSPPNVCRCDSLKSNVLPGPAIAGACCYGLQATVPAGNCFTEIQLHLSSGSFTNIQTASGWTAISNGLQNFNLIHGSGFLPQGLINPANFCVTGSNLYTITVVYYYNNAGALDTCSFSYQFDCPSPPKPCRCDSLTNIVQQGSIAPGLCCYDIKGNVPFSSCFTHIQVSLSNGQFVNVQPQTGWTAAIANLQQFNLNPAGGSIPSGSIYPAEFCVAGANSFTVTVQYYFFNGGQRDSCTFKYSFNCPYVV